MGNDNTGGAEGGPKSASTTVSIRIVDQSGEIMKFRIKRTSKVSRVVDEYCARKVRIELFVFCYGSVSIEHLAVEGKELELARIG